MDLKQIEYIIKIAEEKNITKAAGKLYMTQSALNQQLLKLEKELGTKLFLRSRNDFTLTPAGEIYIANARKMLQLKYETYNRIHDISDRQKGRLSIGFTPGRGIKMFAAVYPCFYQLYPQVTVFPVELSVARQQELIAREELDVGFLTLHDSQKLNHEYIILQEEEIYICVPDSHPLAVGKNGYSGALKSEAFALLEDTPFILLTRDTTSRQLVEHALKRYGFIPRVLFETASTQTALTMVESGVGASFIPRSYLGQTGNVYYSLPDPVSWHVCASYKKGRYLSQPAQKMIELAIAYWQEK